jgi:hypothetical protein
MWPMNLSDHQVAFHLRGLELRLMNYCYRS